METCTSVLAFRILPVILCLVQGYAALYGQSGFVRDTLKAQDSTITIPGGWVHPSLIKIYREDGNEMKDSIDFVFFDSMSIRLLHPSDHNQNFVIKRQMLSPILTRPYTWVDTQRVKSDYLVKAIPSDLKTESAFPAWSDISYTGHFGRGLTIGNAQNATLNSNFDLQLQGVLPHGVEVTGTLSDNSIPIQPEGNSQRLQEFDKVFIRLRKDGAFLIAGDHEVRNPENYFIKYYKKTRGIMGRLSSETNRRWQQESGLNYSISKGKFKRIQLEAEEGNQGPYRLSDTENHLFTVVLAGTERIYLDGVLLQRGKLNDYTIDYNMGEITFTPKIYISARSRITAEYEFAEQNYLRGLFTGDTQWKRNNWSLGVTIYSEQDGKNAYQNNLLTPENEALLAGAEGNVENLQGSSIVPWKDSYEEGVILYKLIDTLGHEKVLQSVRKPTNAPLYTASFTYVGAGNGDYEPAGSFTNGEIFRWVAPEPNGTPNGSYAPLVQLHAPQSRQMLAFGVQKEWGENRRIYSDWSLSHENVNRFADKSKSSTVGWAQRSGFSWGKLTDTTRQRSYRISGEWEWSQPDFKAVSPYRPVEFERDWNYRREETGIFSENLYTLSAQYRDRGFDGGYHLKKFESGELYSGHNHDLNLTLKGNKVYMSLRESLLYTQASKSHSVFSRPGIEWGNHPARDEGIRWRMGYEGEYNDSRENLTDTLTPESIRYDKFFGSLRWGEAGELTLSSRNDYLVGRSAFTKGFRSDDIRYSSRLNGERNNLQWIGTLRHLKMRGEERPADMQQEGWNLLGQLLFSGRWFSNGWTHNGEVSVGNGKEPQRQFRYIRVETGKGQYKHVDLNGDSIQQINEFFPAVYPDERNYIRVSTLDNQLVSTFNYNFSWASRIRLSEWTDHSFWSKWSSENSVAIDNRQLRGGSISFWNIPDTALISSRQNLLVNVYFDQNGQKFREHIGYWVRAQKDFLNSGSEDFGTVELFSKTTVLYSEELHSLWEIQKKQMIQKAEYFSEKNFSLQFWEISHKLRWLSQTALQLEYTIKRQTGRQTDGPSKSSLWSHQLSSQYRPDQNWSLQSSIDYSEIRYEDTDRNPALELTMLEGLLPGKNFLWEVNLQRRLPNDLVLSLRYNGRKSGARKIVHQGSVQANLLF